MAREGDLMRREIRRLVIPKLAVLGFSGKGLNFQRKREVLDVLSLQYWKYGGQFILEFASIERGDLKTYWGDVIPEEQITVAHILPPVRARLEQRPESEKNSFNGFVFEGFGEDQAKYENLALQVASHLPQVDTWLRTKQNGTHVRAYFSPR